jgi:hypothetical protein
MAPIKFEDKLKERLESRTLQPSSEAWKTLSDRLDQEDKRNNRRLFWWLSIAASMIGVIFVSTQFFKTETIKEVPIVLETTTENKSDLKPIMESTNTDEVVVNSEESKEKIEMISLYNNQAPEPKKAQLQIETQKEFVVSQDNPKDVIKPVKVLTVEELKIIEVVTEIERLQAGETSITDQEIDALLKQAQREILKQRILDEGSLAVNAELLLQDVEVELEQSFREKVFEALKSSYNSVKTAVAERRN